MQKCHLLIVVANSLSSDQALQNGVCMHRSRLDPPPPPRLTVILSCYKKLQLITFFYSYSVYLSDRAIS